MSTNTTIAAATVLRAGMLVAAMSMAACGGSGAPASSAPPPAAAVAYDLPALMQGLADVIDRQTAVYRKASSDWSTITDADRSDLWQSFEDEMRLGRDVKAMLDANPGWLGSTCEWFVSAVYPKLERQLAVTQTLSKVSDGRTNRRLRLWIDAAPSDAALKGYLGFGLDHPGSPRNLHIMCIKFGYLDADG